MKLPWVSRLAYEEVCRQRDRIEARESELIDQIVRISRVERGLTELKSEKRKPDPVPDSILNLISGFKSSAIQTQMLSQVQRQRQLGVEWDVIETFIRDSLGIE